MFGCDTKLKTGKTVIFFTAWNDYHRNNFTFTFRQTTKLTKIFPAKRTALSQGDKGRHMETFKRFQTHMKCQENVFAGKFQLH